MGDVTVPTFQMNLKFQSTRRSFVPFLIFTFLVCGVGALFCPMPASATDAHHSQPASHHSSSSQTTGEWPDQLTSSAGSFETDDVPCGVLSIATFTWLHDIPNSSVLKFLGNDNTPNSTTYPLLFLLFSVFLNWISLTVELQKESGNQSCFLTHVDYFHHYVRGASWNSFSSNIYTCRSLP